MCVVLQVKKTKVWGDDNRSWNLFIVRFYDCEMCSGEAMTPDSLSVCHRAVLEHYDFAYCRLQRQVHPDIAVNACLLSYKLLSTPSSEQSHAGARALASLLPRKMSVS